MDQVISFVAEYLFIPVIALTILCAVIFYRKHLLELILGAVFIGVLSYLISKVGSQLISDPRPFIQTGVAPLIPSAQDNGFPSDHTLLVGLAAGVLYLVNRKASLVVGLLALLIGLARVYAGVHHLLDIAGSLVIIVLVTGLYLLMRGWWQKKLKPGATRQIPDRPDNS